MTGRLRSPVLGYNHNIRHRGRVFHVQTEDSGPSYARLYTHLFLEGTILASKKQEYDPISTDEQVRAHMQRLHKEMIRELARGTHDARIVVFLSARGEALAEAAPPVAAATETSGAIVAELPNVASAANDAGAAKVVNIAGAVAAADAAPSAIAASAAPLVAVDPTSESTAPLATSAAPSTVARETTARAGSRRTTAKLGVTRAGLAKRAPVVVTAAADGVVVRRNMMIDIGGGAPPVDGTADARTPPVDGGGMPAGANPRPARAAAPVAARSEAIVLGGGAASSGGIASPGAIRMPWDPPLAPAPSPQAAASPPPGFVDPLAADNEKGLDEVILEYLSDDAEAE